MSNRKPSFCFLALQFISGQLSRTSAGNMLVSRGLCWTESADSGYDCQSGFHPAFESQRRPSGASFYEAYPGREGIISRSKKHLQLNWRESIIIYIYIYIYKHTHTREWTVRKTVRCPVERQHAAFWILSTSAKNQKLLRASDKIVSKDPEPSPRRSACT